MKHLLTLAALLVSTLSQAQQMPYNPDANGDDFVGVDDVLGVLGVYDTALMQPDLECDYEGTEFESFIVGLVTGALILDSVYVEYLIRDTLMYFTPGCPDAIVEPIVLERSYIVQNSQADLNTSYGSQVEVTTNYFTYLRSFQIQYFENDNEFALTLYDEEVGLLPNISGGDYWDDLSTPSQTAHLPLPFPNHWTLDEDGFQIDWRAGRWTSASEYFRLIPFWHEAE